MAACDSILRSGTVVVMGAPESETKLAGVSVTNCRIFAVSPGIEGSSTGEVDSRGLLISPGAISLHAHFNEPGCMVWEGLAAGTRVLATVGATPFVEMVRNARRRRWELRPQAEGGGSLVPRRLPPVRRTEILGPHCVDGVVRVRTDFRDGGIVSPPLDRLLGSREAGGTVP